MADVSALCRIGLHARTDTWADNVKWHKGCWGDARDTVPVAGAVGKVRYIAHACRCACHVRGDDHGGGAVKGDG